MTRRDKFRLEMFMRVVRFIEDNHSDFAAGIVAAQLAILKAVVTALQTLMGDQTAGFNDSRFQTAGRETAREDLREMMAELVETARSMVYRHPGIDLKFRMPRNRGNAEMLAAARAMLAEAIILKNAFIEYGMNADFLEELAESIETFENSLNESGSATDQHVEATADIGAEVRKGMIAVRTIDAPIRNKYRGNPGKSSAWESASHVEREPKPQTTPPA